MRPEDAEDVSTLMNRAAAEARSEPVAYVLVVADGPDQGKKLTIDASKPVRSLAGQSAACELRLTDPHVSRRHAAFGVTARGLHLVDLRSTNGTFVNGVAVVEAYLEGGEVVRVGSTSIRVDVEAAPSSAQLAPTMRFGRMVGASEAMRRLYPLCERLAASNVPVVVEGETGTGKELLAEAIHEEGPRAQGPFVVFDCTAVAPNLLESALFGHERGAFTGAVAARKGVFEQADGGTLLVDEIGDLDVTLQAKLLRAIERSEVQRVGGEGFVRVDVRVIAATRRDLDREVQEGRFRDDLFYRLAVARIELPPLREREGDVALLARHFWRMLGGAAQPIPADVLSRFEDYDWPGNVRELHNAVARRLALGELEPAASSRKSEAPPPAGAGSNEIRVRVNLPFSLARQHAIDDFERIYIAHVLERHGGNVVRAAEASGIARRYFHIVKARHK